MNLPPLLRIQATIVKRHVSMLAKLASCLDSFPHAGFVLSEEEAIAAKSGLEFALAILAFHEDETEGSL